MKKTSIAFGSHLCKYVGIGLISGSVVHAGTLGGSSLKYVLLMLTGIGLFLLGLFLEEDKKNLVLSYIILSILVSIGTGMVSGATQHFLDGPMTAAVLLSLGLWMAGLAFFARESWSFLSLKNIVFSLMVAGLLYTVLYALAHKIDDFYLGKGASPQEAHAH